MTKGLDQLSEAARWHVMVEAAKRGAEEAGYSLKRMPGRGLSNVWALEKDGVSKQAAIRTTRNRWIAFVPLEDGERWKTLDDVELVLIASVDSKERPRKVEVYLIDAGDVRDRFAAAYKARTKAGHSVRDSFGMWVALDRDDRRTATSAGSGIADKQTLIAVYPIEELIDEVVDEPTEPEPLAEASVSPATAAPTPTPEEQPLTIAEAKRRLALTLGVDPTSIKITVEA